MDDGWRVVMNTTLPPALHRVIPVQNAYPEISSSKNHLVFKSNEEREDPGPQYRIERFVSFTRLR